ncbi:hypothetical protein HIJ39_22635 [Sulfobacillus sp. DSM 109850]|uniref:DUF5680 domain-containing protein n=1 Tax=Sulfobacillus harzensis TaxID=2729629 RepID=A0A7Y0Q694_9FIRM|nr:hypothetical protein [Sulfobacillus harzensis]
MFDFLAKRQTYAAQGDDASVEPLLPGARQLKYGHGAFFYQDVYFGVAYFVGQETVYDEGQPYWSMSYAGGVDPAVTATDEIRRIYAFLRSALREVSVEHPFRGPSHFRAADFEYRNTCEGQFDPFHGTEVIRQQDRTVYTLHYSGSIVR